METDYYLLATDRHLEIVGDPIVCWSSLDVTLKFNEPDAGIAIMPGYPWIRDMVMAKGRRLIVVREGQILTAGPIEKAMWEQSDNGANSGDGVVTVNFGGDFAWLAAREVYPDPTQEADHQIIMVPNADPLLPPVETRLISWTVSGNAEVLLRTLVDVSGGPSALPQRRVPNLVLGQQVGVGTNIQVKASNMQSLGDLARDIAESGGGLGFRVRQVEGQLVFEVYTPTDKSHIVRFGFGLGNMRYRAIESSAPTCTTAFVGGQGEGGDAAMIVRTNADEEAAWGRYEKLVPQSGSDDPQVLQDNGDKALGEGSSTVRIATSVSDSPDQRFGTHYQLGDIVSLETGLETETSDVVRTVHLQVSAGTGEYVSATIGSQEALTDPVWVKKLREIEARLATVERNVTPI